MNRDWVLFHLREAAESITQIVQDVEADAEYSGTELMFELGHLYQHLNTAWNSRDESDARVRAYSDEDAKAWSQFPVDLPVLGAD